MAAEHALAFLRAIDRNQPPPAVLIAGPQGFLREYALERIRMRLTAQGFSYRSFQLGGGDGVDAVLAELDATDLFAPRRLVVARLLRSFRDRGGAADDDEEGGATTSAGRGETDLAEAFERVGPTTHLAIVCERDTAPAKLRRAAEQHGVVITCARPFDNQLGSYAELFARDAGWKLDHTASELLVARHGGDLAAVANAIVRAAITAAPGAPLSAAAFDESGGFRIPELFELAEAIARGGVAESLALLARAVQTGRDPIEMLAVEIIPQLRRMLVAAAVLDSRKGSAAVASALGMPPHSAMVARACDGARHYGLTPLRDALRHASELDERFKQGLLKEREAALAGLLLDLFTAGERTV